MGTHDAEFLKKLLATFAVEAEEHIAAIGSGLVELENASAQGRRMEILETIFREAHSLKGAARAVNLGKLEGLCQSLESVFAGMKTQETTLSPELFDRLHQMVTAAGVGASPPSPRPSAGPPGRPPDAGNSRDRREPG